jgi:hypothetical protein
VVLTPGVPFAVVFEVFDRLIPMTNRRKVLGRWITGRIPIIEDYRGAGGLVGERFHRDATIRLTVVGSPGEQRRVCPHEIDISLFTVGDAELMYHRVSFKIDPDRAYHVLVAQDRSPEQVDDGVGAGIQILDLQL